MGFNFPNSPSLGQSYTPVGGYQYVWDGVAWRVLEAPQLFATAESRNRIVNGAMQISQENGNTVGTVNSFYGADQWASIFGTSATVNTQRVQVLTPNGSQNRYRVAAMTADTSLAAGDVLALHQKIEGNRIADFMWGAASARQVVLRFGWKSPAGTYAVALQNIVTANRSYIALFTISAGQANTDTEQTLVIPGDVTGGWAYDTSVGIQLWFTIAAGSSFNGVAGWQAGNLISTAAVSNGLGVAGNVFELFDVGLYLDPDNTGLPPKWQMPDEAEELRACQRYWQTMTVRARWTAASAGHTDARIYTLSPPMRITTPAVSGTATATINVTGTLAAAGVGVQHNTVAVAAGSVDSIFNPVVANARM